MSGKGTVVPLPEPIDPGIDCKHCLQPIEVWAVRRDTGAIQVAGLGPDYQWRHRDTGDQECVQVRHAGPYDGWVAYRAIQAEQRRLSVVAEGEAVSRG